MVIDPTSTAGSDGEDTLTTTVNDPKNPGQPWTVTTIKASTESYDDFILRHRLHVAKVRKFLDQV